MPKTFCTIITADYYPYAVALYKSLKRYDDSISLQILVTDNNSISNKAIGNAGVKIIELDKIKNYSLVSTLENKYAHVDMDFLRWSLKPVFMSYLLENGFDKVIFADCDLFFFNDYNFLFDELDDFSILLTPGWLNSNPFTDEHSFECLLTSGLFNAGLIGANKFSLHILAWWANACLFRMGEYKNLGILDDQRYLNVLPVKFENVKIIRHRGCNLSAGNHEECERRLVENKVMINGQYPVICIHFTPTMVGQILKGHDPLLLPYFQEYQRVFEEDGADLTHYIKKIGDYVNAGRLSRLKWKLSLRSRIKRVLYRLSQKI